MSNDDRSAQAVPAVGSPVERGVRPAVINQENHMTDEQRQEIMRRQSEGTRAMSKEEMARRQLEVAYGARNAWPDLMPQQLAQASQDWWRQEGAFIAAPVKPTPTRWARFKRWLRA